MSQATLCGRVRFALRYLFFYCSTSWGLVGKSLKAWLSRMLSSWQSAGQEMRACGFRVLLGGAGVALYLCRVFLRKPILDPLVRGAKKIQSVHENISSRALYALVDSSVDRRVVGDALSELTRRISSGQAPSYVQLSAIMLALKIHELDAARRYAAELLQNYPNAYSEHQQAGVWFFIGGHYGDAETVWGGSAELREQAINEEGLDRLNMRLLGQSWLLAIGHIAHIDIYIKHKILSGRESQRTIIPFPRFFKVPNVALLNCWEKHAEIRPSDWATGLTAKQNQLLQDDFWSLRLRPGYTRMFSHAGAQVQSNWDKGGHGPLLTLPPDLEARGWEQLEGFGVPSGQWFVCLHVREPGFHKAWHERHPGTRNADVLTYLKAVKRIIRHGGYVVRMGDATMTKLPPQDGLIDYAHSEKKSDEMDVFLCAKAKFFIGTNSGLGLVPPIFGIPCALTNWTPIALPQWYGKDRFIPKAIYSTKLGRELSLTEMFSSSAAWHQFQIYFDSMGLVVQDNSAEELEELVIELLEETSGQEVLTAEDEKLVQGYNRLAIQHGSYIGARLGRDYLRRHAEELSRIADQGSAHISRGFIGVH